VSREGRKSDYVCGRLDAAERLLGMLEVPPKDQDPKELVHSNVDDVRKNGGNLIRDSILNRRQKDINAIHAVVDANGCAATALAATTQLTVSGPATTTHQ
jgi:hypothetical protein